MLSLWCLLRALVAGVLGLEAPPAFVLDLSKPPISRWKGAVEKVLKRHPYEYSFGLVFRNHAPLFDVLTAAQRSYRSLYLTYRIIPQRPSDSGGATNSTTSSPKPASALYLRGAPINLI